MFVIDTNTAIFFFKGHPQVVEAWTRTPPSEVSITSISLYELLVGITTSIRANDRRHQLNTLLKYIQVIGYDQRAAECSANIRAGLQKTGNVIGPLDTLIAGIALAHNYTLVTNNLREFRRVEGLTCVDWTTNH